MKIEQLDDWQRDILKSDGHIVVCSGRQSGKSTVISILAAEAMVNNKGFKIIIVSTTEDQSELMIIKILDYLEKTYGKMIAKGKNKPIKSRIRLTNGSEVLCRPVGNTGDAVRGFTGNMLIADEAAFMPESLWISAKPTLLTTGGRIILVSTPHGKSGYFWECYQNKHDRFKVYHIDSEQVINNRRISEYWTETQRVEALRHLEEEKKDMSKLQYAQEYLGQFVDDLRQFFPDELIQKCCTGSPIPASVNSKFYLGVDIARLGGDETALEVVKMVNNGNLHHAENITKVRQLTTDTIKDILYLNTLYKFRRIYIDTGGIGAAVFDQLLSENATRNITEAIDNSNRALDAEEGKRKLRKEELYTNLLRLMERGEVTLLNDDKVKMSLKSVQYEYVTKENRPTKLRIFGNYTHIVEGLIRACWCASTKHLNLWVRYS